MGVFPIRPAVLLLCKRGVVDMASIGWGIGPRGMRQRVIRFPGQWQRAHTSCPHTFPGPLWPYMSYSWSPLRVVRPVACRVWQPIAQGRAKPCA
jgi:hypothetical protein